MADSIATVVNWYGPYTQDGTSDPVKAAGKVAAARWGGGLYAAVGSGEVARMGPKQMLYMGVGEPLGRRLVRHHHRLSTLDIASMWLGDVAVPGIPGRKAKRIRPHLDYVEWASAFFLELPYNVKKRGNPPPQSCVITNRWWGTDFDTSASKPVRSWADIIEFDAYTGRVNLVWFDPKPKIQTFKVSDFERVTSTRKATVDL